MRNFGLPCKVVFFPRNPEKCCSTSFVTGNFREFNLVSKTEKGTLCSFSTSSPGLSYARFSKWWLVERSRPWSRLGHVVRYLQKFWRFLSHFKKWRKPWGQTCARSLAGTCANTSKLSQVNRVNSGINFLPCFLFSVCKYFLEVFLTHSHIAMT